MNLKAAFADLAGFFSKGDVEASDPGSPRKGGSDFGPMKRLLTALMAGVVAATALAAPVAAAGPGTAPTQVEASVEGYLYTATRNHNSNEHNITTFSAKDVGSCLDKAAAIAHLTSLEHRAVNSRVTCVDGATGKPLAFATVAIDKQSVPSPDGHGRIYVQGNKYEARVVVEPADHLTVTVAPRQP